MTIPGAGGQSPPRPDQQYQAQQPVPVSPGGQPLARVTEIIVTPGGVLQGIFTYSSNPPAAGTLIESASVISAGVDKYGNKFLAGHSSYGSGIASSVAAGGVSFYTGSLSAGWTSLAIIYYDAALSELLLGAGQVEFNAALVTIDGALDVGGVATFGPTVTMNGGLEMYNDQAVLHAGAAVTGGTTTDTLDVTGTATVAGALTVTGGLLEAQDGLTVGGNINANTSVLNIANGDIDLNMASPANYPTSGKTLAQTQACLDGLIGSMINRQLIA